MKTVLLVHGAWHGAWCWHRVAAGLEERGVPQVTVELPLAGLAADADAARRVLDGVDGEVVACGHSYGGFVISRLTSPDAASTNVAHLVYLCAIMTAEGTDVGSLLSEHGSLLVPALRPTESGLVVDDDALVPSLYADCSPEDIALAVASLRPMPLDDPVPPPVRPGFSAIASTYVLCRQDRAIPPTLQRLFAANADRTVEWDTSHSPFFSRPDLVVDLLAGLAA